MAIGLGRAVAHFTLTKTFLSRLGHAISCRIYIYSGTTWVAHLTTVKSYCWVWPAFSYYGMIALSSRPSSIRPFYSDYFSQLLISKDW